MLVTIEISAGPYRDYRVTKADIQKNIDALDRAIDGKPQANDFTLLMDTQTILEGIQQQLPDL